MKENITVIYNVVNENQVGLFAILFRILVSVYDLYPGKVYIDWSQNGPYQNSGESKNIWDLLYEQPDVEILTDDYIISKRFSHHIWRKSEYNDVSMGPIRDNFLDNAVFNPTYKDRVAAKQIIDKKFRLKKDIKNEIDLFFSEKIRGKKCLAVHRRGCPYSHNNTITNEKFNKNLLNTLQENSFESVFLCADNWESKNNLKRFIEENGYEVIIYNSHIANNTADDVLYYAEQIPVNRNLLAREALIEVYLMSICSALYRACSQVTTFTLLLNPNLVEYHVDRNLIYK